MHSFFDLIAVYASIWNEAFQARGFQHFSTCGAVPILLKCIHYEGAIARHSCHQLFPVSTPLRCCLRSLSVTCCGVRGGFYIHSEALSSSAPPYSQDWHVLIAWNAGWNWRFRFCFLISRPSLQFVVAMRPLPTVLGQLISPHLYMLHPQWSAELH
jgi:hypothetical protein